MADRLEVSGARGASFAEVARRVGSIAGIAVPPTASDAQVLDLLSSSLAEVVAAAGYRVYDPVRVATTSAITRSGLPVIDGVQLVEGDRVLDKDAASASSRGIYVATASGFWPRASDFDGAGEAVSGAYVLVLNGDQAGGWVLATPDPITIGTTPQTWRPFRFDRASKLRADLEAVSGSGIVGFAQSGVGAVPRSVQSKLRDVPHLFDYVPPAQHSAILAGSSSYDITPDAQRAIDRHNGLILPPGLMRINPVTGLVVRTGTVITGAGCARTILQALPGGGTLSELAAYQRGSIIRREFDPDGPNEYVTFVTLSDFAIVLSHPAASVTSTQIQIGVDLRNITRSLVERVFVGNIAPSGGPLTKPQVGAFDSQGYAYVLGTTNGPAYAGGEVNVLRACFAWGAYKCVVADDLTLSPLSATHSSLVDACDIQSGHHLLVQESQFGARSRWVNNTVQNVVKQAGDTSDSYLYRIEGENQVMRDNYAEAGSGANFLLYVGSASKACNISLGHCTATIPTPIVTDNGRYNLIDYFDNAGTIPGGVDSKGPLTELYDGAFRSPWVKFRWTGTAIAIEGGVGITVSRNGIGDYTLTFARPFKSDDYSISIALDTNASADGGMASVVSHTASNLRIQCQADVSDASAVLDPRFVWVRLTQ